MSHSEYIKQRILQKESIEGSQGTYLKSPEDLFKAISEYNSNRDLHTIHLVIGEPGIGKSRLMEELKRLANEPIEGQNQAQVLDTTFRDLLTMTTQPVPSSEDWVLIDALDEIPERDFSDAWQLIQNYAKSNSHLVITCRKHVAKRQGYFDSLNNPSNGKAESIALNVLEVQPFFWGSASQMMGLELEEFREKLPNISYLRFHESIFAIPRYLGYVKSLYSSNPEVFNWSQFKIIATVVEKSLRDAEKDDMPFHVVPNVKKALKELAFFMNCRGVTELTMDEYAEFQTECLGNILGTEGLIESFLDKSLIRATDAHISFDNVTLQSGLAAAFLFELGDPRILLPSIALGDGFIPKLRWEEAAAMILEEKRVCTLTGLELCQNEVFALQS